MTSKSYKKSKYIKKLLEFKSFISNLKDNLVPLISYVGSLISIFALKFLNSGKFVFNNSALIDWLFLLFLVFIFVAGILMTMRSTFKRRVLIVSREELEHLITVERYEAVNSIYSVCGDLSWLERDKVELIELMKLKENLTVKVLYNSISDKTKSIMFELISHGIDFIKYENFDERLSCNYLLVDQETDDRKPIVIYKKIEFSSHEKDSDKFTWSVESSLENSALAFVKRFVQIHDVNSSVPIKVGLCGVNNVGKTSLVKELEKELSEKYKVKLFDDEFEAYKSTDTYTNLTILHRQLVKQQFKGDRLCLYDRTSIDNYAYFICRAELDKKGIYPNVVSIISDYFEEVNKSMEELDLLVMITNKDTSGTQTSFVDIELKDRVNRELLKYFRQFKNKNKQTILLEFNGMHFNQCISDAREKVCSTIKEIANSKSKARVSLAVNKPKNEKVKSPKYITVEIAQQRTENIKKYQRKARNQK
jgi:GTPase SAR1 family protein